METEFVLSLGEQQWTLPPGADTITIGRASNADIRLQADDQISRIHARLNRDGGTWTLHDESRNGTGLNGRRLTAPTPLTTGDRIHIGRSVLTFHKSSTPASPDPTTAPTTDSPAGSSADSPAGPAAGSSTEPSAGSLAGSVAASGAGSLAGSSAGPVAGSSTEPSGGSFAGSGVGAPTGRSAAGGPEAGDGLSDRASVAGGGESSYAHSAPGSPFGNDAPASDQYAVRTPTARPDVPPSAQPDQPAAAEPYGAPSTPADQSAGANSYAPTNRPPADESPFAEAGQVRGGNPFAAGDQGAADGESFEGPGDEEYGAAGVVPGFEPGDGGPWAAYPSADNPEPVRSPWEISAQIDQSEPNWNQSDSWPDPSPAATDRRASTDRRSSTRERRAAGNRRGDQPSPGTDDRHSAEQSSPGVGRPLPGGAKRGAERLPGADRSTADDDAIGTVRLSRVLIAAGGVLVLGLIVNLVATYLADGPGGALRWLVPPTIALVVAMVLALLDAAAPKRHRPGRLDVSVLVAIAVVLVGVGVGGFALTAGGGYLAGYLTGNESGEDRLIKPVAKPGTGVTMTVENVTYTSHFTRVEVKLTSTSKQAIKVPIDGTTFTAADGTALRADPGRSAWPSRIAAGGTEHGTITFKGHLPDSATTAVLTFKSGNTSFPVSGITLTN